MYPKKYLSLMLICFLLASVFSAPLQARNYDTYASKITIGTREMVGNAHIYELIINDEVVLRYRSAANGYTAAERARIILQRAQKFGADLLTKPILASTINGSPVVMLADQLLITVTQADWEANNTNGLALAQVWTNNLKRALGSDVKPIIAPTEKPPQQTPVNPVSGEISVSQQEQQMLQLINQERVKAGLKSLQMDSKVVEVARLKSQDMITKNYFDHNSPTYGDPFTMMKNLGVSFGYAGENLAGNQTVERAHEALMNSPGHRANILNPNYTHVGIGIVEGGEYGKMFTQLFISK